MPIFGFGQRDVKITKPDLNPPLAGQPAAIVATLGGPLGDVAHDETALARATALATGEHAATFGPILMRIRSCFGFTWRALYAVVIDGSLHVFSNSSATSAMYTLAVKDCACEVGEREDCRTDSYCFRLRHSDGAATFCAYDSKTLLLWLQALQSGGVKYEDPPVDLEGVNSLFELRATLLSGEEIDLSRYEGCVCLVVNAASK